jgi:hypothetical protein
MATSPPAASRDDDPVHPNFDGIRFQATTDHKGVIAVPISADRMPPVTYLPAELAAIIAVDIAATIERIREADPQSYLADFLDDMLNDLTDAIETCRGEAP